MVSTERPVPDTALDRVGHVIISFPPQADMQGALSALFDAGGFGQFEVSFGVFDEGSDSPWIVNHM